MCVCVFSVQKCACVLFFALARGPGAGGIQAGGKRPRSGQFDTADDHVKRTPTQYIESAMARPDPPYFEASLEPPHLWLDDAPNAPAL